MSRKVRRSHSCLSEVIRYFEEEIAFREIRHVCNLHNTADSCALLGDAENSKLAAWETLQKCMLRQR